MSDRPLADSQVAILLALHDDGPLTPNQLGRKIAGDKPASYGSHGRGNVRRRMGPAVRVIPAITGLRNRGLTNFFKARDGGYPERLTVEGEKVAAELAANRS